MTVAAVASPATIQAWPPSHTGAVAAAHAAGGVAALAALSATSWVLEDEQGITAGRGAWSPTALYFRSDERPSPSLRALASGPAADAAGLRDYLRLGFAAAPRTVLDSVRSLPPGSLLHRGRIEARPLPRVTPAAGLAEGLCAAIERAPADFILLSGGVDSAAVAWAAVECGQRPVALHARFPAIPAADDQDSHCARALASHLGLRYEEVRIGPRAAWASFAAVVRALDAPLADPVTLAFYHLLASAGGRVLTGEGGDQFFGSWSMKPMLVRESYASPGYDRVRAYAESFHKLEPGYREVLGAAPEEAGIDAPIEDAFACAATLELPDRLRWVDIHLKGMQHILPRIEMMARRHDVSLVHPWFEPSLLGLSFALPPDAKLDGAREKPLLKALLAGRIPQPLLDRPKAGMGVPTTAWFSGWLRPLAWRWLNRRRLGRGGRLDPRGVRAIASGERRPDDARPRRLGDRLWMLCLLEAWFGSLEEAA